MRKRPESSVTTMRTNFVGRSEVSAMTQTPASGPAGPVTAPPMSSAPTCTKNCLDGSAAATSATNTAVTVAVRGVSPFVG